ncbi:MAG: AbrB/MazE/SpoVT family DNA-binding domain-containing protein [Thermodesulfobacteriota bacterium]
MAIVTISEKGQLVIPKKLRIKYGLKANSQVEWVDTGQGLVLIPIPKDPVKSSRGMLVGAKVTTGTLLKTRERDKKLENIKSQRSKK